MSENEEMIFDHKKFNIYLVSICFYLRVKAAHPVYPWHIQAHSWNILQMSMSFIHLQLISSSNWVIVCGFIQSVPSILSSKWERERRETGNGNMWFA